MIPKRDDQQRRFHFPRIRHEIDSVLPFIFTACQFCDDLNEPVQFTTHDQKTGVFFRHDQPAFHLIFSLHICFSRGSGFSGDWGE
jgi:hypothetical protein